jgi:hypothetical protein
MVKRTKKRPIKHNSKIDGEVETQKIAELFKEKYKKILANDAKSKEPILAPLNTLETDLLGCIHYLNVKASCQSINTSIGFDNIHSNHLKFAPIIFYKTLAKFYTACFVHSYIPPKMLYGNIKPLIKDKLGNKGSSDNFRPIMNSSVLFKVFEWVIKQKIEKLVPLSDHQHGFRKNYSTITACLTLKETISYYIKKNSNVYACFLDLTKAFDNVDHAILIEKLKVLKIPNYILHIISYMYRNQNVSVIFEGCKTESFKIQNGVRQGAILSPLFFNIYINSILEDISNNDIGCKLGFFISNNIAYADDVTVMAPNPRGLQNLINMFAIAGNRNIKIKN